MNHLQHNTGSNPVLTTLSIHSPPLWLSAEGIKLKNMENLTLEHLAPYLPFQLAIRGNTHGEIVILNGLKGDTVSIEGYRNAWADIVDVKPILRPLSDLTSDQLIELFEIAYTQIFGLPDKSLQNFVMHGWDYNDFGLTVKDEVFVYGFSMDFEGQQDFRFSTRNIDQHDTPNNQLRLNKFELFQKLFEWHFDVFGLIEKGLAIDINSL